jgi:hypothetical protein
MVASGATMKYLLFSLVFLVLMGCHGPLQTNHGRHATDAGVAIAKAI